MTTFREGNRAMTPYFHRAQHSALPRREMVTEVPDAAPQVSHRGVSGFRKARLLGDAGHPTPAEAEFAAVQAVEKLPSASPLRGAREREPMAFGALQAAEKAIRG